MQLPFAVVTIAAGLLSATAGIAVARRPGHPDRARYPFLALCSAGTVWALAYAMSLLSPTASASMAGMQLAWLGGAVIAPLWFLFVAGYVGDDHWFSRPRLVLLFAVPSVTVIAVLSSGFHGMLFSNPRGVTLVGYAVIQFDPGPLFYLHVSYAIWLLAASGGRLLDVARRTTGVSRNAVLLLVIATVIPTATLIALLFGLSVTPAIDLTPTALGAANALVLLAILQYGLFDPNRLSQRRLFDETTDAVLAVGNGARVTTANPAARELFADEDEPIVGRNVATLADDADALVSLVEGDRRRVTLTVADGSAGGADVKDEGRTQSDGTPDGANGTTETADGTTEGADGTTESADGTTERADVRYLDVTATTLGDGDVAHGTLLVMQDVTDHRLLETTFRSVVENTNDVVCVLADGEITYVSPTISSFGYAPTAVTGEPYTTLVHPEDRADVETALDRATATGESTRVSYRLRPDAGGWRTVESVVADLRDDPAVEGYVLSTRDVTEHREREQRLRVLNRMLRHDLRNDMNVVLGYLNRYLDDDGDRADLERARDRAEDLLELGERAREMDRVLGDDPTPLVDLDSLLADEARRFRERHPTATIHLETSADGDVPGGDDLALAVRHLLDNAVEHHDRDDPVVWLEAAPGRDDRVEILVADDGPGIPEAERAVLKNGAETPLEHGSGVGLWLVQWIVESVGGDVSFETRAHRTHDNARRHETGSRLDREQPGDGGYRGSIVCLELPRLGPENASTPVAGSGTNEQTGRSETDESPESIPDQTDTLADSIGGESGNAGGLDISGEGWKPGVDTDGSRWRIDD